MRTAFAAETPARGYKHGFFSLTSISFSPRSSDLFFHCDSMADRQHEMFAVFHVAPNTQEKQALLAFAKGAEIKFML